MFKVSVDKFLFYFYLYIQTPTHTANILNKQDHPAPITETTQM